MERGWAIQDAPSLVIDLVSGQGHKPSWDQFYIAHHVHTCTKSVTSGTLANGHSITDSNNCGFHE